MKIFDKFKNKQNKVEEEEMNEELLEVSNNEEETIKEESVVEKLDDSIEEVVEPKTVEGLNSVEIKIPAKTEEEAETSELRTTIAELQSENEELKKERMKDDMSKNKGKSNTNINKFDNIQKELEKARRENSVLVKKLEEKDEKIDNLKDKLSKLAKETEELAAKLDEATEVVVYLRKAIKDNAVAMCIAEKKTAQYKELFKTITGAKSPKNKEKDNKEDKKKSKKEETAKGAEKE